MFKSLIILMLIFLISACNSDPIQGSGGSSHFTGDLYPYPANNPVAANITVAAFNEDTQKIVTLSYSDSDDDIASACSVTATTNVSVTQACACLSNVCTVGVTGVADFNGAASFSYNVTAGGAVSNAAVVTLSITAVDDAPVASGINNVSILKNINATVKLQYSDVEGQLATTCAVSTPAHVTFSNSCTCTSGVCSITVKGTEDNSYALSDANHAIDFPYFTYTVTTNGLTSAPYIVKATCPIGYVPVSGNGTLNTVDFCVMKYEASTYGAGSSPKSYPNGALIASIDLYDATNQCKALGPKFDLITNAEWMTIAREVELQDANWSTGTAYSGCLLRGNIPGVTDNCTYDAGTPYDTGTSRDTKAKHVLANGSEVWDMGGNVMEWVLWKTQSNTTSTVQNTVDQSVADINYCSDGEVIMGNCPGITAGDLVPLDGTLSSVEKIGLITGLGAPTANIGTLRGYQGIYGFNRAWDAFDNEAEFGFRCVYRP
jgi:hypothetical protein